MNDMNLQAAALGTPITRLGISFFPVYLPGSDLPAVATGDASGLRVDELGTASVGRLLAANPTGSPVLVPEGEQFLGGRQNRAVNVSVLVAPRSGLEIPVSCLEEGRWSRRTPWRRARSFAPHRVRAAQRAGVDRSLRRAGSRAGDQHGVWESVRATLDRGGVASPTMAASDLSEPGRRDPGREETVDALVRAGPLPGQCGAVVAHGGRIAALELFGAPHLLAAHWERTVRSHYPGTVPSGGRPSADRALGLLQCLWRRPARRLPGVGLGVEHRIAAGSVTGQMLTLDGAVVHAALSCGFPAGGHGHG